MARTIALFLMVTLLACCEMDASGHFHVSYLGCYLEPPYDSLFYKAYLDYRYRIDWTKLPDLRHVTRACAREAFKRNYTYFAIKNYGVCSWGPEGLAVTSKGKKVSGCFLTIGGPRAVSVFKIIKPKVNGGWSLWSQWGSCSRTCGGGSKTRSRTCTNPPPSAGGVSCQGSGFQTLSCNTEGCPVDGGWSSWGTWSICSLSCGSGRQTRARTCTNPSPAAGGAHCVGNNSVEVQSCSTDSCPVNGGWSIWGVWSTCSQTCDHGIRSRVRTCSDGVACQGPGSQSQLCNANSCPVNGGWSNWGAWGSCTQTCGGGIETRSRTCNSPAPANGGLHCPGSSLESQACNSNTCPATGDQGNSIAKKEVPHLINADRDAPVFKASL
ncbi:coadhesin-like [Stylophora pistillata]|uniref:coadhesin-like n=1 Tax=Stylophora pistillata TaxID=50429 RepID=UPI000C047FCA|nr:coadhesin-like [Stylophora pistillata]